MKMKNCRDYITIAPASIICFIFYQLTQPNVPGFSSALSRNLGTENNNQFSILKMFDTPSIPGLKEE
jgi:hypothetical protein